MQIRGMLIGSAATVVVAGGIFVGVAMANADSNVPAPEPTVTETVAVTPDPVVTVEPTVAPTTVAPTVEPSAPVAIVEPTQAPTKEAPVKKSQEDPRDAGIQTAPPGDLDMGTPPPPIEGGLPGSGTTSGS